MVDNVVLAMFVDSGRATLLTELAGGQLFVPPTILDSSESPPFAQQPTAEFAKGAFYLQQRLGLPFAAVRFHRRTAFYLDVGAAWQPVVLSADELRQTDELMDPATWQRARTSDPSVRIKKIDRGEAECAAVALVRGWTLWTDDAAMVALLAALYPGHPVERISDLLVRGVREGLITCPDASALYNVVFKGQLKLWIILTLRCAAGQLVV